MSINLKKRVARLEAFVRFEKEDTYSDRPYTWDKDWTSEERCIVLKCIRSDEPVPPELVEKAHLTRPSGRLAGLSEDEKMKIREELLQDYDDPSDNLEQYLDIEITSPGGVGEIDCPKGD